MTRRGTVPPGWEENPTAWAKRIRLVVLASVGLCMASYLAQRGSTWGALWGTVELHD
jgi:hypothetical protein